MKKSMKTFLLTSTLTLALTCTTYAANTSFSDVPVKHWAYDAVTKLAKAGLVDGSQDGTFRGDRAMSRYEMAILVSKTMDKYEKADADQKVIIDQLSAEFASELNKLGARVAKVESKTNTWVSGETRIRFMGDSPSSDMPAKLSHSDQFDFRQRITFRGNINEDWSWTGRLATNGHTRFGEYDSTGSDAKLDQMNVTAKNVLGLDSVRIGRSALDFFSHGMIGGPGNKDGILIVNKFGDTKFSAWTGNIRPNSASDNNGFTSAQLDWKVNKVNLKTGYYWGDVKGDSTNLNVAAGNSFTSSKGYLVGFDTRIGDLLVFGDFVGSKLDGANGLNDDPNAWMVQLTNSKTAPVAYQVMGIVNPTKKGTDAWMAQYRSIDPGAFAPGSGNFDTVAVSNMGAYNFFTKGSDNVEALFWAYSKVVAKNVVFSLEYQDLKIKDKSVTAISEGKNKTYQAKIEMFY
ncbi:S-layer homology domain-containing protein [Dendrosporobacter sp. 1207_IL3150]|uniref:S-layer homology domain-containing protein n=1 Tax=Dendrosporobacter sp. 1207_IL3150 TaxID=3084054 RepID=UPI002FDACA60